MILYFSATGNCKYVAARLAEEKALKEKESAERKGWRGLFKRVTGQGQ